jgi:hypothetical protein
VSFGKAALFCDGGDVSRTVQDADNHHGVGKRAVVNGIGTVKRDAETGAKLLARRGGQREIPHRLKGGFDRRDKAGGGFLRRPASNISPDFGKVGFGGIREVKG